MKKISTILGIIAMVAWLVSSASADTIQTLDLSRSVGHSPVVTMDASWLVPHGHQVLDGVPFQIDGSLLLRGTNSSQKQTPGWTNVSDISVGHKFEQLHLLAGSDTGGPDGIPVAKVRLTYSDNSDTVLELVYGAHLRSWLTAWHKEEPPLLGTNARVVWTGQNSTAAQSDKFLRLYHVTLANPSPDKEMRSLAFEYAGTQYGLLLLAASVGPASAERLSDTVASAKNPFPDLRPRTGEPAQGEGFVKSMDGKPLANATIGVMASRALGTMDRESSTQSKEVGTIARTDSEGHFVLPPLPDDKLYRLLVVAEGFDSKTYRGLDPKSDPVEIRLKPMAHSEGKTNYSVRVRVVGPDEKPVAFAVITPDGVGMGGGTRWGGPQGFPDTTLTGTNGEFSIGRSEPFDRIQLRIVSPGLAPNKLWLPFSNVTQTVRMGVGAALRGRVLLDGKPLTRVRLGLSGQERNSEVFAGIFNEQTDTNGYFVFEQLPPDTAWYLYGAMESFKTYGALPPRIEQTTGHGQSRDLGDLKVIAGLHLSGLVKTKNGEPLPPNLKVILSYENSQDSQTVDVDPDGKFRFDGLAKTEVSIYVDGRGWNLAGANRSMDNWNPWRLVGQLEQNKDDLWLMIVKGDRQYNYGGGTGNGQLPTQDQSRSRPISGVEPSGTPPITLAGQVVDDDTGQPVPNFQVVPGYKPPGSGMKPMQKPLLDRLLNPTARPQIPWDERIFWMPGQKESFSNGLFSVDFIQLSSQPVLQIEASGYELLETDPTNITVTNLLFRLKKGVGPNGVVLLPNGQLAAGATVVYAATQEQFSLTGTSLSTYGRSNSVVVTAGDGKFSFAPRTEGITLFVSHPAGWATKSVARGSIDKLSIELEPWCTVVGTLIDSNNVPAAGIRLELTMFHDWQHGGALANLQFNVSTDPAGNFTFTNVPPGRLELQRMIPSPSFGGKPSGGFTYRMQTPVVARPAITNDLGKITMDHPPAGSPLDAIRSRLGL